MTRIATVCTRCAEETLFWRFYSLQGQKLLYVQDTYTKMLIFLSVFQTRKDTVKFTPYSRQCMRKQRTLQPRWSITIDFSCATCRIFIPCLMTRICVRLRHSSGRQNADFWPWKPEFRASWLHVRIVVNKLTGTRFSPFPPTNRLSTITPYSSYTGLEMGDSPDLTERFHVLGLEVRSFLSDTPFGRLQSKEVGVGPWSLSMQNLMWLCRVAVKPETRNKFRATGILLFTF